MMPNFVCDDLKEFNFPQKIGNCEYKWVLNELKDGQATDNKLIFVNYETNKFLLEVKKKDNCYVIKGDKITKISNISHLHAALNGIKEHYAIGVQSDTLSQKRPMALPFVLEPERLISVLNGYEQENSLQFPQLFGIWNFEYYDEIRLEIGFGNAKHLLYRAQKEPSVLFIGVEIYRPGIAKASKMASDLGLKNVLFTQADMRQLSEQFKDDLFSLIYMHFPIPWNDSPSRRAINTNFVLELNRILKQDGKFQLRSDDKRFFLDSAELFLRLPNADIRVIKDRQIEVISKYEERWREQDKDIYDLIYTCDKHPDSIHDLPSYDFRFESINEEKVDEIKRNFKNYTIKSEQFFIHFQTLFEDENKHKLLLKLSMGDFYAPCNVYIMITKQIAAYLFNPPATRANAAAHERLKEYFSCQK